MQLSAQAAAGLERFRAAFAASAYLPDEELRPGKRNLAQPCATSRQPRARDARPAPALSRQHLRDMSTRPLRDQRLSNGAARLAGFLVALGGHWRWCEITRARLAGVFGVSRRTIARWLQELREHGYIATSHTLTARGATAGLLVRLLPSLLAYYVFEGGVTNEAPPLRPRQKKGLAAGPRGSERPRSTPRPHSRPSG
jgi:hypothetical protein